MCAVEEGKFSINWIQIYPLHQVWQWVFQILGFCTDVLPNERCI